MAEPNARIEQFRKMAAEDPDNELGHFSLGRAYLDAGMADAAVGSFQRAIEINPQMSRAYHLLGVALLRVEKKDLAIEALGKGIGVAHARGDMMPRDEMIQVMREIGGPVPELKRAEAPRVVSTQEVFCHRCNRIGQKQLSPPFSNAQGREIQEKICQACWREWIAMGTKVINELRLSLADPESQRVYDQHMKEFLNLG